MSEKIIETGFTAQKRWLPSIHIYRWLESKSGAYI